MSTLICNVDTEIDEVDEAIVLSDAFNAFMESLLVPRIGAGDIRACPLCEEDDTIPEPEKVTPLVAILMRNATNIIAIFKII